MAAVTIHYTPNTISVVYKDSSNLNQHGDKIHRDYNRWVRYLYGSIMSISGRVL